MLILNICIHILHIGDNMVNMTLAIPEELFKEMKHHSDIKWSDVARQAFEKRLAELHWMDELLKNSKFTEQDAERIGHKIKGAILKRFEKKLKRKKE